MNNLMKKLRCNPTIDLFCKVLDRMFRDWGKHYSVIKHSQDYSKRSLSQAKIDKINACKTELLVYLEELGDQEMKLYRGMKNVDAEGCLEAVNEAIDNLLGESKSDPKLVKYAKRG